MDVRRLGLLRESGTYQGRDASLARQGTCCVALRRTACCIVYMRACCCAVVSCVVLESRLYDEFLAIMVENRKRKSTRHEGDGGPIPLRLRLSTVNREHANLMFSPPRLFLCCRPQYCSKSFCSNYRCRARTIEFFPFFALEQGDIMETIAFFGCVTKNNKETPILKEIPCVSFSLKRVFFLLR